MYQRNQIDTRPGCRRRRRRRRHAPGALVLACALGVCGLLVGAKAVTGDSIATASKTSSHDIVQSTVSVTDDAPATEERQNFETGVQADDWRLILVNPWSALPADYKVTLTQLKNGHSVDERCYPDLQAMMDNCRAAGLSPVICSSYRSQEKQEKLFNNKVNRLMAQGNSQADARTEAGKSIAVPGTSEHQTGLALDIVDLSNQNLNKSQESTAVQKWLMAHSWEYGFILRYPDDKSEITGIVYEPWHYRYVGKDAAREIYERDICLEEYLEEYAIAV